MGDSFMLLWSNGIQIIWEGCILRVLRAMPTGQTCSWTWLSNLSVNSQATEINQWELGVSKFQDLHANFFFKPAQGETHVLFLYQWQNLTKGTSRKPLCTHIPCFFSAVMWVVKMCYSYYDHQAINEGLF